MKNDEDERRRDSLRGFLCDSSAIMKNNENGLRWFRERSSSEFFFWYFLILQWLLKNEGEVEYEKNEGVLAIFW